MGYLVRMPQMGMSMDQGTVVEWAIEEGGEVEAGETVVVVESEKAEADVEARETGVLRRVLVEAGGVVEPGDPIGIVAGPEEDVGDLEASAESEAAGGAAPSADVDRRAADAAPDATGASDTGTATEDVRATPGARQAAAEADVDLGAIEGSGPGGAITEADVERVAAGAEPDDAGDDGGTPDVRATPGAKRLAADRDVDLTAVEGSGPGGAITEDDVAAAADAGGSTAAEATASGADLVVRERRTLSSVQETIGERLSESYRNAVHVTLHREIETEALESVAAESDHSITDFLLHAAGRALVAHPAFNAHFEDGTHVVYEDVNVGLAVDTGEALLTPVIGDVDEKDVAEIGAARTDLTERVLDGEYTMDDLGGGTFTVSNLGPFGVDSFDPVIDPPQIAILGVGRIRDEGSMTLSLSFDHRVVNGADAARFLDAIAVGLTDRSRLADALP